MSKRIISVDDAVATLSHTSLPSLVVEGGSDVIVLRRLEDMISGANLSVFPVGGRDTVLGVFDRRAELGNVRCILFFIDKDMWVFSNRPSKYEHEDCLTTTGYSIENDMYSDGELERLLTGAERNQFLSELDHFIDWFSNQVRFCLNGQESQLANHPHQVLAQPRPAVVDNGLRAEIASDYQRLIRGHSLFGVLLRQLSQPSRSSKFSSANLLEMGAAAAGPNLIRIRDWISERLSATGCT